MYGQLSLSLFIVMAFHEIERVGKANTYEKIIQCSLLATLSVASLIGNGFIFVLLVRFKFMRTSANVLVANLAIWDILLALIQTPLYIGYAVLKLPQIRGREVSLSIQTVNYLLGLGAISSMILLMSDRLMVLAYGWKYMTWKLPGKIFLVILVQFTFTVSLTMCLTLPLYSIDLGNATYEDYSKLYRSTEYTFVGKLTLASFLVLFTVLGVMTRMSIVRQRKTLHQLNIRIHTRMSNPIRRENRATGTVWIVVTIFVTSLLPMVLHVCSWRVTFNYKVWCKYFTSFLMLTPSAANPVIYFARTQRFRKALRQLLGKTKPKGICKKQPTSDFSKASEDTHL